MDIVTKKFSPKMQKIFAMAVYAIIIVMMVILIKGGVKIMLGHSLISYTLKEESASFVSSAKLLSPVFAAVLG